MPMNTTRTRTALTSVAMLALLSGLTACADSGGDRSRTAAVDAEHYFYDYAEGAQDSAGSTAPYATTKSDAEPPVIGPLQDNTFVEAGTSGFVETRTDATSTFGLDVDTGSWGIARTLLDQGEQPPPESIRVEEWINAQPYADPAPTDDDLALTAETAAHPSLDDAQLTRLAVSAREMALEDLPPINLTLVVDRSGSMDLQSRLGLVKTSLGLLAENLRPDDSVAVVGYDDRVSTVLAPTEVRETEQIVAAIDELTPRGSTDVESGLVRGYELAREAYREDAVNVVVLASDGVANVGATGPDAILERIASEGKDGIHLVTVGFGMGNYNDHLMEQLADRGDGFYAYVDTVDEARRLFVDDLASTLTPVAAEAKTQVELDPELVESWRQVGYDNRQLADEDFDDPSVDAGEVGAGHHVSALYELRVADGVEPGTQVGTATVRWTPPEGGAAREIETPIIAGDGEPSDSLALAALVADFAATLKQDEVTSQRDLDLDQLHERATSLERAGVDGASELSAMIALAQEMDPYPVE